MTVIYGRFPRTLRSRPIPWRMPLFARLRAWLLGWDPIILSARGRPPTLSEALRGRII